jgi:hypothetical protein
MPILNWRVIANFMGNRSPRQCRERYKNYLAPTVRVDPWSPEEETLLLEKFREMGPKWAQMTEFFPDRTAVSIKNHYAKISQHRTEDERGEPEPLPVPIIEGKLAKEETQEVEEQEAAELPEGVISIFRRAKTAGDAWFNQEADQKFLI